MHSDRDHSHGKLRWGLRLMTPPKECREHQSREFAGVG